MAPMAYIGTLKGVRMAYLPQTTRWLKNFEDIFIRFDVIHERDGRTDRHRLTGYRAVKENDVISVMGLMSLVYQT